MSSTRPLSEQVVLVTGAARGIGAGIARQAAARGAKVSLVGIEPDELAKVAAECGPNAAWFEADVTEVAEIEAAVEATVERFGGIDVVVVNAGIASGGTMRTVDPAAFERVIEVNLMGSWRTIRAALPHVIERKGYVLQIASFAAIAHPPVLAAYNASKAGVEAMANALRTEVAYLGVDVGVAYYSWIDTDMVRGADERPLGRRKMAGPLGKSTSLDDAVARTVEGIERRRRWIAVPGWVRGLLLTRGPFQLVVDYAARRQMRSVEQDLIEAIEREGAAAVTAPVGAGGAADTRTHAEHLAHAHDAA